MPCPGSLPGMSPAPSLAMGATVEHVGSHKVCLRSFLAPTGVHGPTRVAHASEPRSYVCILYCPQRAPLLLPWLGEVEGTSLAMSQAKASPVPALAPMFRVSPVLRRLPTAVCRRRPSSDDNVQLWEPRGHSHHTKLGRHTPGHVGSVPAKFGVMAMHPWHQKLSSAIARQ